MKCPVTLSLTTWVFILTILLTAVSYYPGLSGDYMFDDHPNLLNNKRLDIESLSLESLHGASYSSAAGLLRRPVSMFSFSLNRYFFGIAPYSHKVVNLVIHLLTGVGLFLLSRQLLSSYREYRNPELSDSITTWVPVIVTGLWLVHPLNLTSVLYIVQRMTSLAALFTVCGLYLYVVGRRRMLSGKSGLPLILTGLFVFGALAILSKENGVLLPLYMLVLEMTLFRFRNDEGRSDKPVIAFFLITLAVPACLFLLYLVINPAFILGGYNGRDFTLTERVLTEARVLVFYLKMIIMPSITELGLYHDDINISYGLLEPRTTLYAIATLISLFLTSLLLLKKHPLVSLGILWFFAGHALESTIFPLEIAHEHRNYLADFGIILAATAIVVHAPLHRLAPAIRTAVPFVFFILFLSTTWLRAGQWSDNINHALNEARHHPESPRAVFSAGRIHARLALHGHTDSEEKAYAYLTKAAELDKTGIIPNTTLIKFSYLLGKPVNPAWFDATLYKLSKYPIRPDTVTSLGTLADCIGTECDIPHEIMEAMFNQALPKSNSPELASIYGYYLINKRGEINKGMEMIIRATKLKPQDAQGWINLIEALTVLGRFSEAEQKLATFRATNTHGGNEGDYRRLQEIIDAKREEKATAVQFTVQENG